MQTRCTQPCCIVPYKEIDRGFHGTQNYRGPCRKFPRQTPRPEVETSEFHKTGSARIPHFDRVQYTQNKDEQGKRLLVD